MSTSILSQDRENTNTESEFNTTMMVDARFVGGTIILNPQHEEWLGETLVKVELPGHALLLRTYEARDLAAALQALANYIDEEPREIRRNTAPGQPEQHGIGGGL